MRCPRCFCPEDYCGGCFVSLPATTEERSELREGIRSVRQEWREKLSLASKLSPTSKLAKKAGVLLLDLEIFEDRIAEAGGEEELVFVICAQVAGGCTLTQWCEHYVVQRGLVWAFLTETPERYERYQRALRGVADEFVSETVGIARGATDDTLEVNKFQAKTLMDVARVYDKQRFGTPEKGGMSGPSAVMPAAIQITFVDARDGRPVLEHSV